MKILTAFFCLLFIGAFTKSKAAPTTYFVKAIDSIPSSTYTKIPIDAGRWYILNYVTNGIGGMFDGIINEKINVGSANFIPTYDCIYPLNDGEAITIAQVKMYSYQGVFSADPVQIYAIKKNGQKVLLGTFTGTRNMQWARPYPDRNTTGPTMFNLDTVVTDVQYIGFTCTHSDLPTELEFYGYYTAPATPVVAEKTYASFSKTIGMNAFEWDFVRPANTTTARIIAEDKRFLEEFRLT